MLSFKEYLEESKKLKTVVLAFGRMNPPTIGHKKLMEKIVSVAKMENADAKLSLSHSQDAERNPLSYDEKIKFVKLMGVKGLEVVSSPLRTIYQVVAEQGKDGLQESQEVHEGMEPRTHRTYLGRGTKRQQQRCEWC